MTEWYRRKAWTKIDEEEFFAKLSRARKDGRAQYLKIQAIELVASQNKELLIVAEALLHKMLIEYPDDNFNKSSALHTLGDIYKLKQDYKMSISYYRQAVDFEKNYPKVKTQAYLDYSELVVKTNQYELFNEVEEVLLDRYNELIFLIEKYKANSILSMLNKVKGQEAEAKKYADLANQFATSDESGLRYHKYLGVVKERDNWFDSLIE